MPLDPSLSPEYRRRFATWLRIEPRCRHNDFGEGIRARTADPLWMLARQWQTGEFLGEDAGSPIRVELSHSLQSPGQLRLGGIMGTLDSDTPLETQVEQELPELESDYRERVRVGQEFERRLRVRLQASGNLGSLAGLLDALRNEDSIGFPRAPRTPLHELDRATQRFVGFMRGRVVDGAAVLSAAIAAPDSSPLDGAELAEVQAEIAGWYARVCARPSARQSGAWQPEKLAYRFEVGSDPVEDGTRLVAPDYRNGTIDWYTFSTGSAAQGTWHAPADESLKPLITTPTRIQVSGNSPRWWAFEDGNTDFGSIEVAKPELAKLLLMEFALIYGDDWFSVPVPVPLGSLARVDELRVYNVFGEETLVKPARKVDGRVAQRFDLFTISPVEDPTAPGIAVVNPEEPDAEEPDMLPILFVPPIAGFRQESAPLEEVRFLRDEGANMVWSVEHTVPNGVGRAVAGFDAQRERLERAAEVERVDLEVLVQSVRARLEDGSVSQEERDALHLALARLEELDPYATPTPSQSTIPRYRLTTQVPANWIPFIPSLPPEPRAAALVEFRRAQMLRNTDHVRLESEERAEPEPVPSAEPNPVPSMSRLLILDEDALLWLREEAIPRAGVRVLYTKQRVRWTDGSTHVWLGRKVLVGHGERASGLSFDVLEQRGH